MSTVLYLEKELPTIPPHTGPEMQAEPWLRRIDVQLQRSWCKNMYPRRTNKGLKKADRVGDKNGPRRKMRDKVGMARGSHFLKLKECFFGSLIFIFEEL